MSGLPTGWIIGRIGDFIQLNPKNDCPDQTEVGFVPLPRLGVNFRSRHSCEPRLWRDVKQGYTHFADGDVLLAKITPCFENGKAGIARGLPAGIGAGSTEYFVCRPHKNALLPEYLLAHFKTSAFLRDGEMVMTGAVGQQRIPKEHILDSQIPLAPFPEQKRIADKLDTLFTRVDGCRDRIHRVPAILKRFRQSVLAAATSGALTQEWRQERGLAEDWPVIELAEVASGFSYGSAAKSATVGTIPVLRMGNIQDGLLDWEDLVYTSDAAEISKYKLAAGDVLFNRTNSPELVGKTAVYRGEREAIYAGYLIRVRCGQRLLPDFLNYCLGSPAGRHYCWQVKSDGVSQSNINAKKLAAFSFGLPSIPEQIEIVRRVEDLLALNKALCVKLRSASRLAVALTPSVLAKAFRGELVPQDPNDEPASRLLERTEADRAGHQSQPLRRQRTPPEKQVESSRSSSPPTPKRDSSTQTAPTRPRRPPTPEPDPEDTSAAPDRRPLDDYTTDEMMCHFRAASRASGEMTEEGLFHLVLARLGFERLGTKVTPILKGHLKAAVGRGIIERDGFFVRCKTPTILHYERPVLIDALTSVMRKNHPYEREEVIQALAVHLGYSSVSDSMRETMKTVFNSAIRQGVLIREGSTITRGD